MQSTIPREPRVSRRWRALVVTATIVAVALTAAITPGSPVYATNYPSWNDVVAARGNAAATATEMSQLQSLIAGLQQQVDAAQAAADKAWADNQAAQDALNAGKRKADQLRQQATAAKAQADASRKQATALTAQFARSAGGGDLSMQLLVGGDKSSDLLYQLGAMSKLSETSSKIFAQATKDANDATSLSAQADTAEAALSALADAAQAALNDAVGAQQTLKSALLEQDSHQAELTVQLAALTDTAMKTEADYNAGVEAAREAQVAAEQAAAAAQAAADAAAAAQAAANPAPSQSSSGGSDNSGNSGGSSDSSDNSGSSSSGDSGSGSSDSGSGSSGAVNDAPTQQFDGEAVVAYAEQYVGVVPYSAGASPSAGFGCDGLTQWVYGHFGIALPRLVSRQTAMGIQVSSSEVRAGDLVVWPNQHIGIYDGNGGVIHSPDWGRYVTHNPGLWGSYIFIRIV
ncbi:C40 family peptidase [Subtercola endophyticus]|uniref:C40 family peptidase n=1 Tax=Subtercola endophyticus TaxID=2895559 RepID=UPI001E2E2FC6|nr:NlpC/P60 family protein [Subtercola endophyticus]UFS59617.1 C40 family peptidase [Subtercola endophyticus]